MLSILLSLSIAVHSPPGGGLAGVESPAPSPAGPVAALPRSARRVEIVSLLLAPGVADLAQLRELSGGSPAAQALDGLLFVRMNRLGVYDLRVPEGSAATLRAARLGELPGVEWAIAPGLGEWLESPDDPSYALQWQLSNNGGAGALAGADVGAELAWDVSTGDPSVLVAILDSGVEITHADLAANIWHNPADPPNGLDDDGNGLVDDTDGWDFFNDDGDVTGPVSHGTRVAGMVGARANDGAGVAGLAGGWGTAPGCRLLCVGVGDSFPDGSVVDDGILYAVDHGARVISLSLSLAGNPAIDLALDDAAANGVLVVCAAGNSGSSVTYPASHPGVFAIAATSDDDTVPSFSSRGPEVDLAAPGDLIVTTDAGGGVATATGTSFSSPLVSAAAGLLFSHMPSLTADDAKAILIASALDIELPGDDIRSGAGRLDAGAALALLEASDCNGNGLYDPSEIAAGTALDENDDGVPDLCELGTPFCFGDGTLSVACPCSNAGPLGTGCANSTGTGARLIASGSASLEMDDFCLHVSGARGGQPGLFLQGLSSVALPFKDGVLCAGNPTERLEVIFLETDGSGSSISDLPLAGQVTSGQTVHYQFWYRDPVISVCGTGSNFSSAFTVEWI